MAATFEAAEAGITSGAGNTRTISSIVGNVITIGTEFTSVPGIGRVLEIINNTGDALNNGLYTVTNVPVAGGGTNGVRTYTVRPTPVAGGTLGSLRQRVVTSSITLAATAITSVVLIDAARAILTVAGANFLTAEVHPGDRIIVTGSAAANNGAWYVQHVLSDTELILVAPDNGAGMAASVVGTIAARRGVINISYTAQAVMSFSDLNANATPAPGPGGTFRGPSSIRDWIRKSTVGAGTLGDPFFQRTCYDLYGIGRIGVDQTGLGSPSSWDMVNEVILHRGQASATSTAPSIAALNYNTWGLGNDLTVTFGEQPGNERSAANGSVLIGIGVLTSASGTNPINLYGSLYDGMTMAAVLNTGNAAASLVRPVFTPGTGVIRGVACYGDFSFVGQGAGDQEDILIASQESTASFTAAATIGGLRVSDAIDAPLAFAFGGTVTLKNPVEDYDLFTLYGNGSGTFHKTYTYNPRYTHFDANVDTEPQPIAGRRVVIYRIDLADLSETQVYDGTTDATGFLSPTPDDLLVQILVNPATVTNYFYRFEESGGGHDSITETIFITGRVTGVNLAGFPDTQVWTRRVL